MTEVRPCHKGLLRAAEGTAGEQAGPEPLPHPLAYVSLPLPSWAFETLASFLCLPPGSQRSPGSLRLLDSWFEATCLRAFARSLQLSQEFGLVPGDSHPHSPLSSTPIVVSASLVDSVCACEGTEVLPS